MIPASGHRPGGGAWTVFAAVLILFGVGLFAGSLLLPPPIQIPSTPREVQLQVEPIPSAAPTPTPLPPFLPPKDDHVVTITQSRQAMHLYAEDRDPPTVILDPCEAILRSYYCRPKALSPSGV